MCVHTTPLHSHRCRWSMGHQGASWSLLHIPPPPVHKLEEGNVLKMELSLDVHLSCVCFCCTFAERTAAAWVFNRIGALNLMAFLLMADYIPSLTQRHT